VSRASSTRRACLCEILVGDETGTRVYGHPYAIPAGHTGCVGPRPNSIPPPGVVPRLLRHPRRSLWCRLRQLTWRAATGGQHTLGPGARPCRGAARPEEFLGEARLRIATSSALRLTGGTRGRSGRRGPARLSGARHFSLATRSNQTERIRAGDASRAAGGPTRSKDVGWAPAVGEFSADVRHPCSRGPELSGWPKSAGLRAWLVAAGFRRGPESA